MTNFFNEKSISVVVRPSVCHSKGHGFESHFHIFTYLAVYVSYLEYVPNQQLIRNFGQYLTCFLPTSFLTPFISVQYVQFCVFSDVIVLDSHTL